jgi:hypothetical protein
MAIDLTMTENLDGTSTVTHLKWGRSLRETASLFWGVQQIQKHYRVTSATSPWSASYGSYGFFGAQFVSTAIPDSSWLSQVPNCVGRPPRSVAATPCFVAQILFVVAQSPSFATKISFSLLNPTALLPNSQVFCPPNLRLVTFRCPEIESKHSWL